MATCDGCNTTIVFGGVKEGEFIFCKDTCRDDNDLLVRASTIDDINAMGRVMEVRNERCPVCGGRGPLDIHISHRTASYLIASVSKSLPQLSCRSCGQKAKLKSTFSTFFLGWWGFPWGLIMTPVQIARNISGLIRPLDDSKPSRKLMRTIKIELAEMQMMKEADLQMENNIRTPD